MRTDKTDVDIAYREFNDHHEPIFITSDIENIMLISYVIRCRKINFDFREVSPFCFFRYIIPLFESYTHILPAFCLVKLPSF